MPIIKKQQYVHDELLPEKLSSYKVIFSDIDFPTVNVNSKIGSNHYIVSSENGSYLEVTKPLINAIDIDWNAAKLTYTKDVVINHSGDLLALVDSISYMAYVSSDVISYLSYRIDKIPEDIQPGGGGTVNEEDVIRIIQSVQYPNSEVDGFIGDNGLVTATQVQNYIATEVIRELATNPDLHEAFDGKSAYEIARENGGPEFDELYPNEAAWVESLKGQDGAPGKSAYEIAAEIGGEDFANKYKDESDWIEHGLKTNIDLEGVDGISITESENIYGEPMHEIGFAGFLKINIRE